MKSLRLLALALLACACTASAALACDTHKSGKADATTASSTVVAKTPAVPAEGGCSAQAMSVASASSGKSADAAAQCSPAMRAACAKHASTAGMDHCSGARGAAFVAFAGMRCAAHQSGVVHDCAACEDGMALEQDARSIGARSQVVPLKNGAMIVYTADSPGSVRALQTLVAKRNDRLVAALSGGSDAKLCDDCKSLRGAMASGKLNREVVNVENGCMALITSNDRGVVQKIRAMTGQPLAMR